MSRSAAWVLEGTLAMLLYQRVQAWGGTLEPAAIQALLKNISRAVAAGELAAGEAPHGPPDMAAYLATPCTDRHASMLYHA